MLIGRQKQERLCQVARLCQPVYGRLKFALVELDPFFFLSLYLLLFVSVREFLLQFRHPTDLHMHKKLEWHCYDFQRKSANGNDVQCGSFKGLEHHMLIQIET